MKDVEFNGLLYAFICIVQIPFCFPCLGERELKLEYEFVALSGLSIFLLMINVAKLSLTEKVLVLFYGFCH